MAEATMAQNTGQTTAGNTGSQQKRGRGRPPGSNAVKNRRKQGTANRPAPVLENAAGAAQTEGQIAPGASVIGKPAIGKPRAKAKNRQKNRGTNNRPAELAETTGQSNAYGGGYSGFGTPLAFTGEVWNGRENWTTFFNRQMAQFKSVCESYKNHIGLAHKPLVMAAGRGY